MKRVATLLLLAACSSPPASHPPVIAVDPKTGGKAPDVPPCADKDGEPLSEENAYGKKVVAVCIENASAKARERITKDLVLREGAVLDEATLASDLASVHGTGVAEDVTAYGRKFGTGVVVVIVIRERPRVGKVVVEGNSLASVTVKQAPGATPLHPGEYYDPAYARERAEALRAMYLEEAFEDATVTPVTKRTGDKIDVRMVIVEGKRSLIGPVSVRGAKIPQAELVKASELKEGETLSRDKAERAPLLVNAYYYDRGYLQVRIDLDRGVKDKDGKVPFTFTVVEGDVFRVSKIDVKKQAGLDAAATNALLAKLKTKPGQIFSRAQIVSDLLVAKSFFADRGRVVEIEPQTDLDPKKKTVDLILDVRDAN